MIEEPQAEEFESPATAAPGFWQRRKGLLTVVFVALFAASLVHQFVWVPVHYEAKYQLYLKPDIWTRPDLYHDAVNMQRDPDLLSYTEYRTLESIIRSARLRTEVCEALDLAVHYGFTGEEPVQEAAEELRRNLLLNYHASGKFVLGVRDQDPQKAKAIAAALLQKGWLAYQEWLLGFLEEQEFKRKPVDPAWKEEGADAAKTAGHPANTTDSVSLDFSRMLDASKRIKGLIAAKVPVILQEPQERARVGTNLDRASVAFSYALLGLGIVALILFPIDRWRNKKQSK